MTTIFKSEQVRDLIRLALREDLSSGDVTSDATVPPDTRGTARIVARQELVVCGAPLISEIIHAAQFDATCVVRAFDGEQVGNEAVIAELAGSARELLMLERTILNFMQRLSGVATLTARTVKVAGGITVLDTRKTTPGWRVLEKYAVRTGGGANHRGSLGDMVLIKNNHVDARGGDIAQVTQEAMKRKPLYMPVEVEVRDMEELRAILPLKPEVIMLDNFTDALIGEAIGEIKEKAPQTRIEVSGGITEARFPALRKLGVTAVSMGALTTQAQNVDISMRLSLYGAC